MSNTIEYSLLRDQTLIDVVDEDWEAEELPTDGERKFPSDRLLCVGE